MDERQAIPIWPLAALLGEGPMWFPDAQALWFVDIIGGRLHRLVPATGERHSYPVAGKPSFVVPLDDDALLVGTGSELVRFEAGVRTATVATIDMPAGNRTNDATVDPAGRLWFGTMDEGEAAPTGRVYRFDGALREMGCPCIITNGPAVSPDGRYLYHVDTLGRQIRRFDLHASPDRLRDGRLLIAFGEREGNPDGVTVDAEGCLWVGMWGGWALRRYSAEGDPLELVPLPCANVTKVAFGGADLRTGYITTARVGLSPGALEAQPLAGGLFAFDAPVPGLKHGRVRLG